MTKLILAAVLVATCAARTPTHAEQVKIDRIMADWRAAQEAYKREACIRGWEYTWGDCWRYYMPPPGQAHDQLALFTAKWRAAHKNGGRVAPAAGN